MTIAEQLRAEGKIEGRVEGRVEGRAEGEFKNQLITAKRLLEAGSDPLFIRKITGLTLEQIKALQEEKDLA